MLATVKSKNATKKYSPSHHKHNTISPTFQNVATESKLVSAIIDMPERKAPKRKLVLDDSPRKQKLQKNNRRANNSENKKGTHFKTLKKINPIEITCHTKRYFGNF